MALCGTVRCSQPSGWELTVGDKGKDVGSWRPGVSSVGVHQHAKERPFHLLTGHQWLQVSLPRFPHRSWRRSHSKAAHLPGIALLHRGRGEQEGWSCRSYPDLGLPHLRLHLPGFLQCAYYFSHEKLLNQHHLTTEIPQALPKKCYLIFQVSIQSGRCHYDIFKCVNISCACLLPLLTSPIFLYPLCSSTDSC